MRLSRSAAAATIRTNLSAIGRNAATSGSPAAVRAASPAVSRNVATSPSVSAMSLVSLQRENPAVANTRGDRIATPDPTVPAALLVFGAVAVETHLVPARVHARVVSHRLRLGA